MSSITWPECRFPGVFLSSCSFSHLLLDNFIIYIHIGKMKSEVQFPCVILFLLPLLIVQSAGQYPICSDFYSPKQIVTQGTGAYVIMFPRKGSKYKSNQLCEWTIETEFEGYGIQLDVIECSLQGRDQDGECNNDYVDIFDYIGDSRKFMGRFCGSDTGKTYQTTSNRVTIQFHSDPYFELAGFQVMYQPVPVGSSNEHQDGKNKNLLAMAVGISVGLLSLTVIVIIAIIMIRRFRLRKNTARSSLPTAHTQNASSRQGLPGGHPASGISNPARHSRSHRNDRGMGPSSRNVPVQTSIPRSANEGGRSERSVTPPPAYDSLDFGLREVSHSDIPLTPPPYELVAKEHGTID